MSRDEIKFEVKKTNSVTPFTPSKFVGTNIISDAMDDIKQMMFDRKVTKSQIIREMIYYCLNRDQITGKLL
jgi:hypothetical protein